MPCAFRPGGCWVINLYSLCPHAGQAFTFLLVEKSKQKKQEKMMLANAQAYTRPAIFSGLHTLLIENKPKVLGQEQK